MPIHAKRITRRSVVGSLFGSGVGWAVGVNWVAGLESALADAGGYFGGLLGNFVADCAIVRNYYIRQIIVKQLKSDLSNSCLENVSAINNATNRAAQLFEKGKVIKKTDLLPQPIVHDIDFRSLHDDLDDIESIRSFTGDITVSCPVMYPAALTVFHMMKSVLEKHDVVLNIDTIDRTSRAQVQTMGTNEVFDFAVMADPPVYISADSQKILRGYAYLMPCFWHEDAILASDRFVDAVASDSKKVYFHAASTAEFMLRTSIFWNKQKHREPILDPNNFSALRDSLSVGNYVTTWEPITSVFLANYDDLVIVPQTKFRSYVSLFTHKSWLFVDRRQALVSFLNMFIRYWKMLKQEPTVKFLRNKKATNDFSEVSGLSYIHQQRQR